MKDLSEQDHYEILETARNAPIEEIERAYRLALATYADNSLAGYSIFGAGDAAALRDRIEAAFQVLGDDEARAAYDATLPDVRNSEAAFEATALAPDEEPGVVDAFEELDDQSGEWAGARLRRTRLRRGVEIEGIAAITKINPLYLRFIEEERFDDLPAAVYVRGFVRAYAPCVGLDPPQVESSYMQRYHKKCGHR